MVYPANGAHLSDIVGRSIIYAHASPQEGRQPFRVYDIVERSRGQVSVMAHHISYDLSGIPVSEINADTSDDAFIQLIENSAIPNPFTFDCQRSVEKSYVARVPKSARNRMMDKNESILATYGGEFRFDHFRVEYRNALGRDKGYRIKYGVNLIDLTQERNFDEMFTGIFPYYNSGENTLKLPEQIVNAKGEFGFSRVQVVNLSSEFSEEPDEDLLRDHARRYIEDKKIGVPKVSINLSHVHLTRFGDFCSAPTPEDIECGDTVWVEYPRYNITVSARVNSYSYDSINRRYINIGVGDPKAGFIKTLLQLKNSKDTASESKRISDNAQKNAYAAGAVANDAMEKANEAVKTVEDAQKAAEEAIAAVSDRVKYSELSDGSVGISGIILPYKGDIGKLDGTWAATPQAGGDPSRIITLQDLYNFGLLT